MSTWPVPPRWLVWLSGALVLLGAGVCVVGGVHIGVTVDETFHVVRLGNYLERGWYLLDDDLGPDGPGAWVTDEFVYAPATALLLHVANVLLGFEGWSTVAVTPEAYAVRHLGVAAIGAIGVGAAAGLGRELSGSWRWGLVTAGMLSALPMWWGHSMFNVKDVPVATGYTLVTLGCALSLVRRTPRSPRSRLLVASLVGVGVLLAIGTRPAMWPTVGATCAWAVLVAWARPGPDTSRVVRTAEIVVPVLAALALLVAVYPSVFARPDQWVVGSVSDSSASQMMRSRGHLPFSVVTTVPVVLLVLAVLGSYGRAMAWRARPRLLTGGAPVMVLVLVQALLLPTLLVVSGAALSGGLRHVLFAAPAVACLVAAGLAHLLGETGPTGRQVLSGVAAVGMLVPALTQLQLFPYSYAYENEVASLTGVGSDPDFWQASLREYAGDLGPGDFVVCGAALGDDGRPLRQMPNGGQSWLDVSQECRSTRQGVLAPFGTARSVDEKVRPEFVALRVRLDTPSVGCRQVSRVTRPRLFGTVVMSAAEVCPLVLLPYREAIGFDATGDGAGYLLGGWSGTGGDRFVTADRRADLGFSLTGAVEDLRLRIGGDADGDVRFLVNNEPARATRSDTGWTVSYDGVLPPLGDTGNVVLTVLATGGPVRVTGVEVAGGGA